jgi:mannosylglycerate hydrolase MGH1-like protein/glycosyl hydrolase family 63
VSLRGQDAAAVVNATVEEQRLQEDLRRTQDWKRFGPYLSERQWGTVREDYSADGDAWGYFTHDQARSRAYRWGEDGLLGLCDRQGRLCFALALWNGVDPILKERLFGLTGPQGNHGEDVKEQYFYLDATPTHSYGKALYKYPQRAFPYQRLVEENRRRGRTELEFEITDTGIYDDNRYFDVFAEYAKAAPNDLCIAITVANRGPDPAPVALLPTLWFRNTWSWGRQGEGYQREDQRPSLAAAGVGDAGSPAVEVRHPSLGRFRLVAEAAGGVTPELIFTENETNLERLYGKPNPTPYRKDAFHAYVVGGQADSVNPARCGTKAAALYRFHLPAGGEVRVRLRLVAVEEATSAPAAALASASSSVSSSSSFLGFDATFDARRAEADEFYLRKTGPLSPDERLVVRQAYAGLLWTKQFYHYDVNAWLDGDPTQPTPPASRLGGRNADWRLLYNRDVISMPDKWEYPWYAAWDLAFHMIPFARIDPAFAKEQLLLLTREWYMQPNGKLPAYEFSFDDANPPVHAWAVWRVYKIAVDGDGQRDRLFLERMFQKLLLNFTWWVNRKDASGRNLFSGGFLGLDNIGVFDRSRPLPGGGFLEQADGTAWMAFYCLTMLSIALELATTDPAYEDMASKFLEHFVRISDAMNNFGGTGLWDDQAGFYYDRLHVDGTEAPVRLRSLVGLLPLIAAEVLEDESIDHLPAFRRRMSWFLDNQRELAGQVTFGQHGQILLAIPSRDRLVRVLRTMLAETEFLSANGIRSMSKAHGRDPYRFVFGGESLEVHYEPGESESGLFGGNSNWRGPIWMPINYLLVEALERYHHFYGDELRVECPVGSGHGMTLKEVARELSARLARIFLADEAGQRPWSGGDARWSADPHWRGLVLFHEYFHGETGRGLGASHQTGWTALAIRLIEDLALSRESRGKT